MPGMHPWNQIIAYLASQFTPGVLDPDFQSVKDKIDVTENAINSAISGSAVPAGTINTIGLTTDSYAAQTLFGRLKVIERHIHSQQLVYPTLAADIPLTSAAPAWTLGAITQIVPANTITKYFDLHFIGIDMSAAANGIYEIVFYSGEANTEVTRLRVSRVDNFVKRDNFVTQTPVIAPNSKISAALASSAAAQTVGISISYHVYE